MFQVNDTVKTTQEAWNKLGLDITGVIIAIDEYNVFVAYDRNSKIKIPFKYVEKV